MSPKNLIDQFFANQRQKISLTSEKFQNNNDAVFLEVSKLLYKIFLYGELYIISKPTIVKSCEHSIFLIIKPKYY